MKIKFLFLVILPAFFGCSVATAQINFVDKVLETLQKVGIGLTFSYAQVAQLSKNAVIKMDVDSFSFGG